MKVAIAGHGKIDYCREAPFNPSNKYPEYPFNDLSKYNTVYDELRNLMVILCMDKDNYNTSQWNPLGEIIKPGDHVLIKPNLVRHHSFDGYGIEHVITHGSLIRGLLDYVLIALKGKGSITVGDAPIQEADFEQIIKLAGIDKIMKFYEDNAAINVSLVDFRNIKGCRSNVGLIERKELKGDPLGYTAIDLGRDSELFGIIEKYRKFRVTCYDSDEMLKHHNGSKNEYLIANSVLNADVIINLPKLKTHRKSGITCALKNMIGTNCSKDWLPHYTTGSFQEGFDAYLYKSLRKRLLENLIERMDRAKSVHICFYLQLLYSFIYFTRRIIPFKDDFFEGSWYGNDTLPRTTIDINKIVSYADKSGVMQNQIQRKIFTVVDSIVAGEKEGPLHPTPKHCGLLVAGFNSTAIDLVCSAIMGFDYLKIPLFKYALHSTKFTLFEGRVEDIKLSSDRCHKFNDLYENSNYNFIPPQGWKGHIEHLTKKNDRES